MLVGIVAGLLSFGFLKVFGEPQVDRAIAFETQMDDTKAAVDKTHGMHMSDGEPELVSRPVQAGIGLFTAVIIYSAAFGGLFGLAFAVAQGRLPGAMTPRSLSALLAAIGFIAISLVPSLKYPASPPAVGEASTIGLRTALYFIMIAISLAAMVGAISLKRTFAARATDWSATLMAGACYFATMIVVALVLPGINEVPDGFPANALWNFRVVSLGAQLIMWTTFGLLFGALSQRTNDRRNARVNFEA
jgi:hypothetical protein